MKVNSLRLLLHVLIKLLDISLSAFVAHNEMISMSFSDEVPCIYCEIFELFGMKRAVAYFSCRSPWLLSLEPNPYNGMACSGARIRKFLDR